MKSLQDANVPLVRLSEICNKPVYCQVEKKKGGSMAQRRKEQQLQQEIETQEEWEDMLSKEGLCGTYLVCFIFACKGQSFEAPVKNQANIR